MIFFTIGVYNSTEESFFDKLLKNNIDTFCDIRQRRGVRGSKYSYVNSNRLQQKLNALGIKYNYIPNLAPTTEIRELQKEIDNRNGQLKKERQELGKVFIAEYKSKVLINYNFDFFIENLNKIGAERVALFCVEELPRSCHRSIVTDKLNTDYKFKITHL